MILSRWFKLDKSVEKSREGIFSRIAGIFEQPRPIDDYYVPYFDLQEALEKLFGRRVDLVPVSAIRNPYFLKAIQNQRRVLYAA